MSRCTICRRGRPRRRCGKPEYVSFKDKKKLIYYSGWPRQSLGTSITDKRSFFYLKPLNTNGSVNVWISLTTKSRPIPRSKKLDSKPPVSCRHSTTIRSHLVPVSAFGYGGSPREYHHNWHQNIKSHLTASLLCDVGIVLATNTNTTSPPLISMPIDRDYVRVEKPQFQTWQRASSVMSA